MSGVLLIPSLVSFLWFTVFGATGIQTQQNGSEVASLADTQVLFGVFNEFPLGIVMSIIAMLLIGTFFITSADSATFVLGMQTTNGSLNPPKTVKFAWGIAQSTVAAVLLYTGGTAGITKCPYYSRSSVFRDYASNGLRFL
ncbi:glycine betaine transporter [Salimicrobium salexigens]|uniref:Glycine betaine transporter n=1 Tax=Salimicrobium salexigens TaxID=908941 RepID=A0ABY1KTX9_9BACI|nr:glycine betaine transporter [Salimicrobium salexigens]